MRPETCAGAIVVADGRLLLIERATPPDQGRWSLPGGRVEGGESLGAAVEREVAEETGLRVECGRFVGWVEIIEPDRHFVVMDFDATPIDDGPIVAGSDAADARWVELGRVEEMPLVGGLLDFLREHDIVGP
ncbi:MAG: NUDIX domain-containing protein [Acidimicrobiia bacterium]|nr:NUDIX domain-containing protein [Acidimicrobiia bacterium]